jgi:hypothetical protein
LYLYHLYLYLLCIAPHLNYLYLYLFSMYVYFQIICIYTCISISLPLPRELTFLWIREVWDTCLCRSPHTRPKLPQLTLSLSSSWLVLADINQVPYVDSEQKGHHVSTAHNLPFLAGPVPLSAGFLSLNTSWSCLNPKSYASVFGFGHTHAHICTQDLTIPLLEETSGSPNCTPGSGFQIPASPAYSIVGVYLTSPGFTILEQVGRALRDNLGLSIIINQLLGTLSPHQLHGENCTCGTCDTSLPFS